MTARGRRVRVPGLRDLVLGSAAVGTVAVALELAAGRHWAGPRQWVAWEATVLLTVAVLLAAARRRRPVLRIPAALAAVGAVLLGGVGVLAHVAANHRAGPLSGRYGPAWEALSTTWQWALAATQTVGPAPPLAPGLLAMNGVLVLIALFAGPDRAGADGRPVSARRGR